MLGLHAGSIVSADTLVELLWGEDPPRTAAKALQTHISLLRRILGDGFVVTEGTGWTLADADVDASRYKGAARMGRDAAAAGDTGQAVARFEEALTLWRGIPELPDGRRGTSENTRWIEGHAALVEDRADALLATGRAAEIIGELEAAVADAPLRERRWGQLMLALYRAGRQGEALGAYRRARSLLADELGVDPGPDLRRLEAAIVAQDAALEVPAAQHGPAVTRPVTFLLTDIEGSTAAWEAQADAMALALARHDELVEQVVTSRGGRLIKTRGEGDATFSVFERPSAAAAAAIELQDAISHEPWALAEPMRVRVALHTGEAELRDGDYFGRAVNRAARLRSLAEGGQILCSGAIAELVIDSLPDDVALADLGMRKLRNLTRPEHVFELRLETDEDGPQPQTSEVPIERPSLPAVLAGTGPFVGRGREFERLYSAWQTTLAGATNAVLIAGEPGVGKTRLAGEWSRQAYDQGALVIYGRCDEDLGAPYQPFAEALRSLLPCVGADRLHGLRGVEALLPLVPGLTDLLPDLAAPTRADPDTERYALFDAVVTVLGVASTSAPVVLILDDLHWAAKPTLLLLRHLLRFGERSRVQIIGTYRSTDLDRSHPLAAMLADLHRDGTGDRLQLSGLDADDVTAYVAEAGYDDEELARALASVTGGNPFFLIEALRHVDESGGRWDQSTLPQGVREAVSRRLSRLTPETNKALGAAAVVGSRFGLELVERVVGDDLLDAFDEACKAGIVIEESGGNYRFNHALVRQSLLAELASVRRMRLHQRIATTLETQPGANDELLAELAYHYFECAWAGNAAKAVDYCRRAADQAMARLAYEGAADLYDRALHALEEIDDELPDRDDQTAELLVARCEALLAAGDVASAAGAVSQLQSSTVDSARLAAWATCFDGQLSMLTHPERLDEIEAAVGAAANRLAALDDAAGEAMAHTVRAGCLARLGRIGDCEIALDDALTAARRAREHRRVNAVLAQAPLAALWGPNPVPRAGGRCLDVVRLLRITTDSPAVEATSTRCQAVLEAFRGRAAAARRMIDSARRTATELGLRHALLEVEQFAGIVELVVDDPATAEPHLRKAYNGFRRMGLDADTAETAALLGRTCLSLGRDAEADELCSESERLAGHALKPSIAWRTLRARLLSREDDHDAARRVAEAAVSLAERTDALVDHGDACSALATVLGAAGDAAGARAAAERAVGLYERKGAAALADKARNLLGTRVQPVAEAPPKAPSVKLDNAAARVGERVMAAIHRRAWDEVEALFAPDASIESRRKIVGLTLSSEAVRHAMRRELEMGTVRVDHVMVAARGERLALSRLITSSPDVSPGAPQDELLQLYAINDDGQVAWQVWFDVDDMDAALAELDAAAARFEEESHRPARRLENAASRLYERFKVCYAARDWGAIAEMLSDDLWSEDRRRVVNAGIRRGPNAMIAEFTAMAEVAINLTSHVVATRGANLALSRVQISCQDQGPDAFSLAGFDIVELDDDGRGVARIVFDLDDFEAALAELDARYLAGEAAAYSHTWSVIRDGYAALNRHEVFAATPDWAYVDHRSAASFEASDLASLLRATWDLAPDTKMYIEAVHQLTDAGAVLTHAAYGTSREGFDAEWRMISLLTVAGDLIDRCEVFDEADLDTAIARLDQLSRAAPGLKNWASQITERLEAHFEARDWTAVTEMLAADVFSDDRRRVVNAGIRRGRDAAVLDARAQADLGVREIASTVIATRGERLVLRRARYSGEAFHNELLSVFEIGRDDQVVARVVFDLDDFEAAIGELDARYLAGEAAAQGNVLQSVMDTLEELNRHEPGPMLGRLTFADHRRVPFGSAEHYGRAIEELWTLVPDARYWMKAIHALGAHGLVSTLVIEGTDSNGNELQWGRTFVFLADGPRVEVYEEDDVEVAVARFEELRPQARRLENTASQVTARHSAYLEARDWDGLAKVLAEDFVSDDRRRAVNAGIRHGRDAEIANMQAVAEVGITHSAFVVIAARSERLILIRAAMRGGGPAEFGADALSVVEINSHNQIAAIVVFELDDFESALAELDARYVAGEAVTHAHTWSVVTQAYAALNRREPLRTTPDWVNVDHRHGMSFAPGELRALLAAWNLASHASSSIETVHRLNDLGAVVSSVSHETSQQGVNAEWRVVNVLTIDGDRIDRLEVFDEEDLDAAIAKFEQLSRSRSGLDNTVAGRFLAHFNAHDWDAMAQDFAENYYCDDRRRVVNAGIRDGRDAAIEDLRVSAEIGLLTTASVAIIASRGDRLLLTHWQGSGPDREAIQLNALQVIEHDTDGRIAEAVLFDVDDIDAAFEELDARYLAGEAADHARTWAVITRGYSAVNRHELPGMTTDPIYLDHRAVLTTEPEDLAAYLPAVWDLMPDLSARVEAVHRLSNLGAVVTHAASGISQEGFDAEWRAIVMCIVEGDVYSRVEVFDEADLDAALARFEELQLQPPRLENATTRIGERIGAYFATRDWGAMAELFADDICTDDRRRVVGAGIRHGRDAEIAGMKATADVGTKNITGTVLATRGERLSLGRVCFSGHDQASATFLAEALGVVETNANNMIKAIVTFDLDDIDVAFEELDARYLAGEAAAHAHTWSVIAGIYAAFNRHELPAVDWITEDHRRATPFTSSQLLTHIRTSMDIAPDLRIHIDKVHRIDDFGAVLTNTSRGTAVEGFNVEWRMVQLLTIDGDRINRLELFDESDLDAALARFDELQPQTRRLENAASQAVEREWACFATRDWAAMAETMTEDFSTFDHRRVVNAGVLRGRDAHVANYRAVAEVGFEGIASTVIATRGQCLALIRVWSSVRGFEPGETSTPMIGIVEIDAGYRLTAAELFDLDELDAAFEALDARYLAGESATHAHTWSVIASAYVATNRRELPQTTQDWVSIDHRRAIAFAPGELIAYIQATWEVAPDVNSYVEAAHRLTDLGAVITQVVRGTSQQGFGGEWREIVVVTVEGDLLNRIEIFDETDLDAALARFEELQPQSPRLENAASRVIERFFEYLAGRNWAAMADMLIGDSYSDDRRHVVNAGLWQSRDRVIAKLRETTDYGVAIAISEVIATRGRRLALSCVRWSANDEGPEAFPSEALCVTEIETDDRIAAIIMFDSDDTDAALAELDARYLAGEGADHAHAWSVIAGVYAGVNRHELPAMTPDFVYIDHRPLVTIEASDLPESIQAVWDLTPRISLYWEAVHRLSDLGAVVTHVARGVSREEFDAEWRMIDIFTIEGDLISRCEMFDEADLDSALARFDELNRSG
ncbi:BTAD domain-containing putative transcriptional regulator [Mycobacterium sp. E3198]|uniref:BTAD domain-containing putative transcriptional regulator n=1 Tax=Mycobacterium sp. E3198 TaxID=1834143 RepID=UPI0007FBE324|nr:hypothetical protein A5673_11435 [Mycobacterium sp. E3198]